MKQKKKSLLQKKIEDENSKLWRNKADKLWKLIVHLEYNNKCAICGSIEYVQAHHLIPREMLSHRHIIQNGVILCCSHHKYSFEISPHKAPVAFFKWLIEHDENKWKWLLEQKPSRDIIISYKDIVNMLKIYMNKKGD